MRATLGLGLGVFGLLGGCFNPEDTPLDTEGGGSTATGGPTATDGPSTMSGMSSAATDDPSATATESATDTADASTGMMDDTTGVDDSTSGEPPLDCVDGVLAMGIGNGLVQEDTAPAGNDFDGSCGGANGPDLAFQWDVPFDGFYTLDTQGSTFDTVLYVLDDCAGPELLCNDNVEGSVSSSIVGSFAQGDRVAVVIDGNAGESGQAVLNINQVECPSADLTGEALPSTFSSVAGTNGHGGVCGGDGNPERAFRWRAPADGLYAFRASSEAFGPIVYLEDGPICGGEELGCNPPAFGRSSVFRNLLADQYVTVFADSMGGAGDFEIDIAPVGETCPGQVLAGDVSGDINTFPDVQTSSCGAAGYEESGVFSPFPDATYAYTSPGQLGANSGCDIILDSLFPAALSLQLGSCDGPEEQCEETVGIAGANGYTATVSVGHIPPTEFTVTVSPSAPNFLGWFGPTFDLRVECWAIA